MSRSGYRIPAFLALIWMPSAAFADDPPKTPEKPPEVKRSTKYDPIEITISPSSAPVPALKYRLFPLESERTPGDAVPVYLRTLLALNDASKAKLQEKHAAWSELPLDKYPVAEARELLDPISGRFKQLAIAARRKTCEWNYPLNEQREEVVAILLPDAQELRLWVRMLAVKLQVEIAEKCYDDAIQTIETGLAFGQHLSEGPFLISGLVGIACETVMFAEVDKLISQPGAPNLYWALTALPRPLAPMRGAMDIEQKIGENLVPEITDLERKRTEAEWSSLLVRLHARLMKLQKESAYENQKPKQIGKDVSLDQFRVQGLAEAKAFFESHHRSTEGMTSDQMIILSIADRYREMRDDVFKISYLPYSQAVVLGRDAVERNKTYESSQIALFAALMPSVLPAMIAETRIDRKVAALRIIEAIRMHVAANPGSLPKSLDEIKIVPIPLDPTTGKSFDYNLVGDTAVLGGAPPQSGAPRGGNQEAMILALDGYGQKEGPPGLVYRIRLAK